MATITTKDGTQIYYKDWGTGQPIVFSHGWPLTADDWDGQMLFFGQRGYRVIAHDRRGHGRSDQTWDGNEMDTYADDLAALTEKLDLKDAIHVGHSTGGGEVARYIGRYGSKRVAKAVLISAVPPLMLKTEKNPTGQPVSVFDGLRAAYTANRPQFYKDITLPFYGYNRLHGRLEEDRHPRSGHAWRRRSDCTNCCRGSVVCEVTEESNAESLSGLSARHAHDQCGSDQRRPAGVLATKPSGLSVKSAMHVCMRQWRMASGAWLDTSL